MFKPRERAFKQFKSPRPQCVNIPNDTYCLKSKVNPVTCQAATEGQYRYKLYSVINFGTRSRWVANAMPQPLYPGNDPLCTAQEALWAPQMVWTCVENIAPTENQTLDHTGCTESLHWLHHLGPSRIKY